MTIKDLVGKDYFGKYNPVYFSFYRAGFMYYTIQPIGNANWYQFSVPVEDIGNGTLNAVDKAILYMRWIRKGMENNELIELKEQLPTDETIRS